MSVYAELRYIICFSQKKKGNDYLGIYKNFQSEILRRWNGNAKNKMLGTMELHVYN